MSSIKKYAKQAKERMKNGFWQKAKVQLEKEKQVAATLGLDCVKVAEEQRRKVVRQIYDERGFREEEDFYRRVVEILESPSVVTNPLYVLADKSTLSEMDEEEKQAYFLRLSARYRQACEKYFRQGGKKIG